MLVSHAQETAENSSVDTMWVSDTLNSTPVADDTVTPPADPEPQEIDEADSKDGSFFERNWKHWLMALVISVVGSLIFSLIRRKCVPIRVPSRTIIIFFVTTQLIPGPLDDIIVRLLLGILGGFAIGVVSKLTRPRVDETASDEESGENDESS